MTQPSGAWSRFRDEVRSVTYRTGRHARRAFDSSVIRVDLVSLRRDRRRALADLGERLVTIWNSRSLDAVELDPEMIRLRARVEEADAGIAAKEAEYRRLRGASGEPPAPPRTSPES